MDCRKLTCIRCPMGCQIEVDMDGNTAISVRGNTCQRGEVYARKEVTDPTRIVTSTVRVIGGTAKTVSCKTAGDVPKGKVMEVARAIAGVAVAAPIRIGDVLVADVAGTGVDLVATRDVTKKL